MLSQWTRGAWAKGNQKEMLFKQAAHRAFKRIGAHVLAAMPALEGDDGLAADPQGLAGALRETFLEIADLEHAVVFIDEVEEIAGHRTPRPQVPPEEATPRAIPDRVTDRRAVLDRGRQLGQEAGDDVGLNQGGKITRGGASLSL